MTEGLVKHQMCFPGPAGLAMRQLPLDAALRAQAARCSDAARARGWARFSPCARYRYLIGRPLDREGPRGCVCLLNPSDANAERDDPTIRILTQRARHWGWGSYEVVNAFASITSVPRQLGKVADPVGPENDEAIVSAARRADVRVVAWGAFDLGRRLPAQSRIEHVLRLLQTLGDIHCLGLTKSGAPIHPLARGKHWVPVDRPLVVFSLPTSVASLRREQAS